ncbi:MAG: transglutaminase domain-containing protein [Flavisolibacter sp.]
MKSKYLVLLCLIACQAIAQKQSPFTKYGKITAENLQTKTYDIDSSADAVVLSDIGNLELQGNSKDWFSTVLERHRVVHILKKTGYHEADVEINLYTDGFNEERVDNLKATTYNLENGKVVETKLDKGSVFKEKVDKNHSIKKFTMPNVKEGSIIEFSYVIVSDYIHIINPWKFQGHSPELWSEFNFSVPQFFSYNFLSRGFQPMDISERKDRTGNFNVRNSRGTGATETYNFSTGISDYRWVMKNVPALREESFTSSLNNHISRLEFQLASQGQPLEPHNYRTTWPELTKELLESEYFGSVLNNANNWLSDDIKPVYASVTSQVDKARRIFEYVRDHITCTGQTGHIYLDQTLKNVLKTKKGSVAEINLLLTVMLRYAGLQADPVILSTRAHGYAIEYAPMITSFNYVVVQFNDNGNLYYLDASDSQLGFNRLPAHCYNGHARVVNETADPLVFSADSLKEAKATVLIIANDEKGNWVGNMSQTPGYYESAEIREKVQEKGSDQFFKEIQKDFGADVTISGAGIDSLKALDLPVKLHYNLTLNKNEEDILYINPMFGEGYRKNPFAAAQRYYPVEMPYRMDETYILNMEVPKGYVVDELPKQMLAKYDEEGASFFEYRISVSNNVISFRTRIKIDRALFLPEEYPNLREFFNLVVKKQNEQIVFKKIK